MKFIQEDARQSIINNLNNIPTAINHPAKIIEIKNFELITEDEEVIKRIRRDPSYGTIEITEITAEDEKAIKIRERKIKEAEEEIKKLKEARLTSEAPKEEKVSI